MKLDKCVESRREPTFVPLFLFFASAQFYSWFRMCWCVNDGGFSKGVHTLLFLGWLI